VWSSSLCGPALCVCLVCGPAVCVMVCDGVWSRSVRTRAGSLHMKTTSTTFQLSRENGDVKSSASMTGAATTDVRKMDEFDIKILQQKRHEAEVKRSALSCTHGATEQHTSTLATVRQKMCQMFR